MDKYNIELANISDIDEVLKLYSDWIEWFLKNNINQWSKYAKKGAKMDSIKAINSENYYIIKNEHKIIAGFEISSDSKNWWDLDEKAYYVYKVVTKLGHKNMGKLIFENLEKNCSC